MYKIIEQNNHKFITIPFLEELGLKNCITTSSLNLRLEENSFPKGSIDDYFEVFNFLNIDNKNIFSSIQNHTDNITIIDKLDIGIPGLIGRKIENNDGLITALEDTTLISFSADCTPIVLFDKVNKIQANIHSGWKGTLQQIGPKGLKIFLDKFKSNPDDVYVILGPSISQNDFEVKEDVYTMFKNNFSNIDSYVYAKKDKYHINLDQINIDGFLNLNIPANNLLNIDLSTFSDPLFHSYRRDKGKYKLMGTFTCICK